MNGPEHFREAERLLDVAKKMPAMSVDTSFNVQAAQVHATLALAAAHGTLVGHMEDIEPLVAEWREATGTTS